MANSSAVDSSAFPLRIRTLRSGTTSSAPVPRPEFPPLSSAQRGLWLLDRLHPGGSLYNVPFAVRLTGPLDTADLERALRRTAERHEVLRTVFPVRDNGEPYQRVLPAPRVPLTVLDLRHGTRPAAGGAAQERGGPGRGAPTGTPEQDAWQAVRDGAETPFDLAEGPLFRTLLVRLADDEHILGVFLHHIVCDGPSIHLLFDELAAFYADGHAHLPDLATQFADHATRGQQAPTTGVDWWIAHLDGAPTVLPLPTDRPRPALRSGRGATRTVRLPGALIEAAGALARRQRASTFMVMTAVYAALLARLTGARDLLIGSPVAGRTETELEGLIGFFVNTLPLRVDLSGDPDVTTLLGRVRDTTLAAVEHTEVPFDSLVEALRLDRDPGTTPLIQTLLTYEPAPLADPRFEGLEATLLPILPDAAKFDLDLMVVKSPDGSGDFDLSLTYSTDVFEPGTVMKLARRFEAMLAAAVADPALPLSRLPLLTPDEAADAAEVWNPAAPAVGDSGPMVHEWVAQQASARPDGPAVRDSDGRTLGYAELASRSDVVAHRLARAGATSGDTVAIMLPRGIDLVTAMLSTLKCGAAYLPLDRTHPSAHLAKVMSAAGVRHVLTDDEGAGRFDETGVRPVLVGAADEPSGQVPDRRPVHPGDLAYTIFTSGSTGEPKGVGVPHGALANHAGAIRDRFGLGPGDRVLQFANAAFDVAAEELFPTWAAGACVVLAPDPVPAPEQLSDHLDALGITVANLPASYWQRWAAALKETGTAVPAALRLLVVGSEPVDAATLAEWCRRVPVPVINAYGLTETTITALAHQVEPGFDGGQAAVGTPLRGVRAYVLDEGLEQLPPGVPGELYIGGAGLARGYLGRPDLTAERFLPDPFAGLPGARMHRTGDRARRRPDGALEVLGRVDEQLKVRGYRIEPGEVEAALCAHPEVIQAAVAARAGTDGSPLLAGYVVTRTGVMPQDLRSWLTSCLPAHLVPGALTCLPELPLSSSGKVNRKALPEPGGPPARESVLPARTDLERRLLAVWQDVLQLEQAGVRDNFFDLGGTSFTLAAVHARLCELLGRRLPLVTLYEHPTIAALAAHLQGPGTEPPSAAAPDAQAAGRLRAGRARLGHRRRVSH